MFWVVKHNGAIIQSPRQHGTFEFVQIKPPNAIRVGKEIAGKGGRMFLADETLGGYGEVAVI